ncbi:MAG: arsenate reductase ArsC [Anaerolineae bacterium]
MLFLCTGNSCRSQIAEGLTNQLLGDHWEAFSAGTAPVGAVHPLAVTVLAELGIDISNHSPKPAAVLRDMSFDLVITVCDDAAENCPTWLGAGRRHHISFPDPARAAGTAAERLAAFRRVRDAIRAEVLGFLASA